MTIILNQVCRSAATGSDDEIAEPRRFCAGVLKTSSKPPPPLGFFFCVNYLFIISCSMRRKTGDEVEG